ncbi:MAG: hypothetical protein HUU21_13100 [Polyangiaceae bacterium]|nr:hypothetical protein [Polyangiaceae bacterium]
MAFRRSPRRLVLKPALSVFSSEVSVGVRGVSGGAPHAGRAARAAARRTRKVLGMVAG